MQHHADPLMIVQSERATVCGCFCFALPHCSVKWNISNAATITNYLVNLHTVLFFVFFSWLTSLPPWTTLHDLLRDLHYSAFLQLYVVTGWRHYKSIIEKRRGSLPDLPLIWWKCLWHILCGLQFSFRALPLSEKSCKCLFLSASA